MSRVLFLLVVGIAIGYFLGFNDARKHPQDIVHRLMDRVGGSARGAVGNDLDSKYDKIGK
jgi:hypothetical protein